MLRAMIAAAFCLCIVISVVDLSCLRVCLSTLFGESGTLLGGIGCCNSENGAEMWL